MIKLLFSALRFTIQPNHAKFTYLNKCWPKWHLLVLKMHSIFSCSAVLRLWCGWMRLILLIRFFFTIFFRDSCFLSFRISENTGAIKPGAKWFISSVYLQSEHSRSLKSFHKHGEMKMMKSIAFQQFIFFYTLWKCHKKYLITRSTKFEIDCLAPILFKWAAHW